MTYTLTRPIALDCPIHCERSALAPPALTDRVELTRTCSAVRAAHLAEQKQ